MTFNPEISWVQHAKSVDTKNIHLQDVLRDIQGGRYKAEVEKIRNSLNSETNEAAELKERLPGIMFSGLFSKRSAKGLKAKSGLICADLDKVENIEAVRVKIQRDPHALAVFVSPSGTGLKVLLRIDPEREHLESFTATERYFLKTFGVKLDKYCKDVCRLCFVSYDPKLFQNLEAKKLNYEKMAEVLTLVPDRKSSPRPRIADTATVNLARTNLVSLTTGDITHPIAPLDELDSSELERALNYISPDCSYSQWVAVGMGLKHQFGDEGLKVWDKWSASGGKYIGINETTYKWGSFSANHRPPVTARSILKLAADNGWHPAPLQWASPIPYGEAKPPRLDLGQVIPSSLDQFRDFVEATAEAVQTATEAVALLCLAIVSAAAGRSFEIKLLPQWIETAVLWVVLLAEPGDRKSALLSKLSAPLSEWQCNENSQLAGPLAAYRERRCILEARLLGLRRKISSPKVTNTSQLQNSSVALALELESTPELHQPDLVTADCTPEALRTLLVRNGEKIALVSAETDFQQLTGSRYSKDGGQNLNLMLAGKTGDPLPGHRITKSEPLKRPAIACALFVQPAAVSDVLCDANTNGRGLVQRFIIVHPVSRMGSRALTPPPVSDELENWWDQTVRGLLDSPWPGKVILSQGSPERCDTGPQILDLDPAAHQIFSALRQDIEGRLKEDGDLRPIQGFASKLPGDIARIALCLELMQDPHATVVSGITMTAACKWAEFLIAHHKTALGQASECPARRHARRLVASLERNPVADISERDCFRRLQNTTLTSMEDLQPVLADLIAHQYLRRIASAKPDGRGQLSSQRFEVNPVFSVI